MFYSSLSKLKGIYEDNYSNLFFKFLLPIYDLNNTKVKNIILEIEERIDEQNDYLEMSKIKKFKNILFIKKN